MMHTPLKLANPIFTHFTESTAAPRPGVMFFEDEEMMIFPTDKDAKRSQAGHTAAMSYVHLLAIPKRRIYNAVSLRPTEVPLVMRMIERAKELLTSEDVRSYYLHQVQSIAYPQYYPY
jgi:hypothetical protein